MSEIGFPKPEKLIHSERLDLHYRHLGDAKLCFELVDKSREHLRPWMPWEESTQKVSDSENYFKMVQDLWEKAKMFDFSIFLKDTRSMIGSGGIHSINWEKRSCDLGYWLGAGFEGQGYATEATLALEKQARSLGFHKIRIECDPKNKKSAAIPKRLGYVKESLSIDDQCVDGKFRDTLCFVKIVNPEVPGFITENFPRGYGAKKLDFEEFCKIRDEISTTAWNNSLIIQDPTLMEYKSPATKFNKFLRICYLLYCKDKPIGWFHGYQTHTDTFHMTSTYILPEHQDRKLYSRILDIVVNECCKLGFQRITSKHSMTHSKIIAAKLKRGFIISGSQVDIYAGTLVKLTYFNNDIRRKITDFRCGLLYPDEQIKRIFEM